MTQHPPHPQRCETCNPQCPDYVLVKSIPVLKDKKAAMDGFSSAKGCASHTTPASHQRIEQVINMLELQVGCSEMLHNDEDCKDDAYPQLRDECIKAIAILRDPKNSSEFEDACAKPCEGEQ